MNRKYLSTSISFEEKMSLSKKYSGEEWNYVKSLLSDTQLITQSAVRVVEVIKKHFDIELFPTIFKVACKGWDAAKGTAYFSMMGKYGKSYLFWTPARTFKAMKGEYTMDGECGFYREF